MSFPNRRVNVDEYNKQYDAWVNALQDKIREGTGVVSAGTAANPLISGAVYGAGELLNYSIGKLWRNATARSRYEQGVEYYTDMPEGWKPSSKFVQDPRWVEKGGKGGNIQPIQPPMKPINPPLKEIVPVSNFDNQVVENPYIYIYNNPNKTFTPHPYSVNYGNAAFPSATQGFPRRLRT